MRGRTWLYLLRQGANNILSNRLIHTISVGTIAVSLILLGAFLLLLINANQWMLEWGQSLSVSVYLGDDIDEDARKAIRDKLVQLAEFQGKTVIEAYPQSKQAEVYRTLARKIRDNTRTYVPNPTTMTEIKRCSDTGLGNWGTKFAGNLRKWLPTD